MRPAKESGERLLRLNRRLNMWRVMFRLVGVFYFLNAFEASQILIASGFHNFIKEISDYLVAGRGNTDALTLADLPTLEKMSMREASRKPSCARRLDRDTLIVFPQLLQKQPTALCTPFLGLSIQMLAGYSVPRHIPKYVPFVIDMTMYAL